MPKRFRFALDSQSKHGYIYAQFYRDIANLFTRSAMRLELWVGDMSRYLDIEKWKRKGHFYFFKDYDYPFFNICADVEITEALKYAKENRLSFFIVVLYLSTRSANFIEEFRYRIRDGKVIVHDIIHAGSTVLNLDETFSFCYFQYSQDFSQFNKEASQKLTEHADGIKSLNTQEHRDDLIHYSVIPWISFKSFSNSRRRVAHDSIPNIVFGKYYLDSGSMKMPVSVDVHHALMDGLHVAKFFDSFQAHLKNPRDVLDREAEL